LNRDGWHRIAAYAVIVLGMTLCRAAFVENVIYNIDEAEYAVAADALDHGWLPGVDLLGTTKPPGIVLLFDLLFHVFGRSMAVIHVAQVVILAATGLIIVELAVVLWGMIAAVPAAFLFWMLANSFGLPPEMFALNVESPGLLLIAAALLLLWTGKRPKIVLLAAGLLLGLAVLFRQSYVAFALPVIAVVWHSHEHRTTAIARLAAGFAAPWVVVLVTYVLRGGLGWAWDSWVRYPITYAGDVGLNGFFQAFAINASEFALQAVVPLLLAVTGGVIVIRELRTARGAFLATLLLASLLALAAGSRFWGHYWIQTYLALTLLGAGGWLWLWRGSRARKALLVSIVALGSLVAALRMPTWRHWDPGAPPRGAAYSRLDDRDTDLELGRFARERTTGGETIAVWGYCPQIYYYAQRLPGVRDYLCHYITGYSPGAFDPFSQRAPRAWGHPRAQEMFVADLEQRKPKYIFDLVEIDGYYFTFLHYSLRTYPALAAYLRLNYLPEGRVGGAVVYRRRTASDTWWPSDENSQ
jgi:hypothetical protein